VKDKLPLRGRRVQGFGQAAKADTFHPQFLDPCHLDARREIAADQRQYGHGWYAPVTEHWLMDWLGRETWDRCSRQTGSSISVERRKLLN
jgi:hypothetical protein